MTENDINELSKMLSGDITCAIKLKNGKTLLSSEKGIKPLMIWISEKEPLENARIADKVIGRAAAFLAVFAGIKSVYTDLISEPAREVFLKYNIDFYAKKTVSNIINRMGTDICPMEKAVLNIDDAQNAFKILKEKSTGIIK
ncbi:MAG: DUF1893 domain-containing protein [Oscillospiraceae bacterium]